MKLYLVFLSSLSRFNLFSEGILRTIVRYINRQRSSCPSIYLFWRGRKSARTYVERERERDGDVVRETLMHGHGSGAAIVQPPLANIRNETSVHEKKNWGRGKGVENSETTRAQEERPFYWFISRIFSTRAPLTEIKKRKGIKQHGEWDCKVGESSPGDSVSSQKSSNNSIK